MEAKCAMAADMLLGFAFIGITDIMISLVFQPLASVVVWQVWQ